MAFSYCATAMLRPAWALSRLAWLRPASKMGSSREGAIVNPHEPLLNRPDSSPLAVPACAVSEIRGKNAALAAPMLALAAISCCSAWRMSGRRVSSSDGSPAGSCAMAGAAASLLPVRLARMSSGRACPNSNARAFSSSARWRCCWASVARAAWVSDSAWRKSSSEATPASRRILVNRMDSSREARVWRDRSSSSSSARRFNQPLATAATRLTCAALRPSSVARYWARACSLRLAMRPKKSISQAETARPTLNELVRSPDPAAGARLALAARPTPGYRSALRTWNVARACSMLSTATRRSRLLARATSMSWRSRGSAK